MNKSKILEEIVTKKDMLIKLDLKRRKRQLLITNSIQISSKLQDEILDLKYQLNDGKIVCECPSYRKEKEHDGCVLHGHCLHPTNCPMYGTCPTIKK